MALPEILRRPLSLPVVASPMFIVSGPEMVVAQCTSGIVGSFPALNARPASLLTDWLSQITEQNASFAAANPDRPVAPFAVNQIVHRSNDRSSTTSSSASTTRCRSSSPRSAPGRT
ncbi:MAG: hypothetical protein PGN15_13410 [Aeromicrobium erythreum]